VSALDIYKTFDPIKLTRKIKPAHIKDELDLVVDSLNESFDQVNQSFSEIKRAEFALRKSEQQQSDLLNNTSSVIYIKDLDGRYLFINRMFERLFHTSNQEIIGTSDHDFFPKKVADIFRENDLKVIQSDQLLESEEIANHDDGEHTYLSIKFPLKNEDGNMYAICGISTDISVRKRAEDDLKYLRNYLSNIIDSMPSILIGVDTDCKVTQWNREAERVTGVSKEKAMGQPLEKSFARLFNDIPLVKIAIELRQQKTCLNRRFQQDNVTMYEDMNIYPLEANNFEGAVIRLDDITEKNRSEAVLRRAQKMDAIGQLTGGIAHDFNNILGIIMGNLQLLEMTYTGGDKALERIKNALKGAQRGAEITQRLLNFSREKDQSIVQTDVNSIIGNMDDLITKSLTMSIEVETHFSDDLWLVNVNPGDLEDAILNLSLNAKDAMPEGGILIIETSNKVLDESQVIRSPDSSAGDYVMISISDNGIGMTDEIKERVIEPFFTTKEQGKGTGLGLSMVYGFVQRSGGHLKIYSELGKGTTFHLLIPRLEDISEPNGGKENLAEELPQGTETVLIVDDEDLLIDIATECLNTLGYSVLIASDAEQALSVIAGNSDIDLVFSDIVMPGNMDGYQLAEVIHKEHPSYKILLTSGFTKKREELLGKDNEYLFKLAKNRLYKPYSMLELAIAVRQTLDN